MSVEGPNGVKVLYSGKIYAIDHIFINDYSFWLWEMESVFIIKRKLAKQIANNDHIDLDIEIRCLKEEAKDEDIESGVSEGEQ